MYFTTSLLHMICAIQTSSAEFLNEIPYIDNITINGDSSDWDKHGFRVEIMDMLNAGQWNRNAEDFFPRIRVGWDKRGLLVLVHVSKSSSDLPLLQTNDIIEIWAGVNINGPSCYQLAISLDTESKQPKTITKLSDGRIDKESCSILIQESVFKPVPGGYIVEALLPWTNLDISPVAGDEIGLQIAINENDSGGSRAIWYPVNTPNIPGSMYSLKLSDKASAPILASGVGTYQFSSVSNVWIRTIPQYAGMLMYIEAENRELGSSIIKIGEDGWGHASIEIPMPKDDKPYLNPALYIGGEQVGVVHIIGDPAIAKIQALDKAELRPDRYVFSGPEFPGCDFNQTHMAEKIIGPYDINYTYYDYAYNPVTTADKPGRYGAVIEAISKNGGRSIKRFKTLFCQKKPIEWWNTNLDMSLKLPEQLGIDSTVAKDQSGPVSDMFKWSLVNDMCHNGISAAVLAWLYETKPGTVIQNNEDAYTEEYQWWPNNRFNTLRPFRYHDICARDRQWWVGLKRKIYGLDELYTQPFICPKPIIGKPAVEIREGTLEEAGMKPDGIQKLDELLNTWASDSDESFAACIVRHGVVVLHKAYGIRDGKPMTVNTKSRMFSNTKTLAANLMWMLIDQGLVDLDDHVDKFLPALRGIKTSKPVTIRRLYNHTWGFIDSSHWGDDVNDLEEVMADYFPMLKVGSEQMYNGVGYALGGKIIECITGESIPAFAINHLIKPLGLTGTVISNTSYDALSIPMDMAKVAQMMLNKGAYGDKRFYSEETFNKMLPEDLSKYIPRGARTTTSDGRWGVGLMYGIEGSGKDVFGHLAASGATLRIDPLNDLVITMTRNSVGRNYEKYHPEFIKTVVNAIDDKNQSIAK